MTTHFYIFLSTLYNISPLLSENVGSAGQDEKKVDKKHEFAHRATTLSRVTLCQSKRTQCFDDNHVGRGHCTG